jgi:hypothetical protein
MLEVPVDGLNRSGVTIWRKFQPRHGRGPARRGEVPSPYEFQTFQSPFSAAFAGHCPLVEFHR